MILVAPGAGPGALAGAQPAARDPGRSVGGVLNSPAMSPARYLDAPGWSWSGCIGRSCSRRWRRQFEPKFAGLALLEAARRRPGRSRSLNDFMASFVAIVRSQEGGARPAGIASRRVGRTGRRPPAARRACPAPRSLRRRAPGGSRSAARIVLRRWAITRVVRPASPPRAPAGSAPPPASRGARSPRPAPGCRGP